MLFTFNFWYGIFGINLLQFVTHLVFATDLESFKNLITDCCVHIVVLICYMFTYFVMIS